MNYSFTYYHTIVGIPVAEIEGTAEIAYDRSEDDWYVASIELDEIGGKRKVILPEDHPLFSEIAEYIFDDRFQEVNSRFWNERTADIAAERADREYDRMREVR